jgi:hypothetical protein
VLLIIPYPSKPIHSVCCPYHHDIQLICILVCQATTVTVTTATAVTMIGTATATTTATAQGQCYGRSNSNTTKCEQQHLTKQLRRCSTMGRRRRPPWSPLHSAPSPLIIRLARRRLQVSHSASIPSSHWPPKCRDTVLHSHGRVWIAAPLHHSVSLKQPFAITSPSPSQQRTAIDHLLAMVTPLRVHTIRPCDHATMD